MCCCVAVHPHVLIGFHGLCLPLQVRAALFTSDASRFFQLYAAAPRLSRRLMDVAVKAVRWQALNTLVRAHKPGPVPLMFLATNLGFLPKPVGHQPGGSGAAAGDASGAVVQQLAALTVDEQGQLLPGCSERSCLGDHAPAADQQQGLAACLEWAEAHGAMLDQTAGEQQCCCLVQVRRPGAVPMCAGCCTQCIEC